MSEPDFSGLKLLSMKVFSLFTFVFLREECITVRFTGLGNMSLSLSNLSTSVSVKESVGAEPKPGMFCGLSDREL